MKQKDFLVILIPGFILTILWVVFNIYHNYATSTITDPLTIQIAPIVGKFDKVTIDKIKKRERVDPLYQQVETSITPAPSSEIVPTAIPTDEITPTDQIPQEGIIPTEIVPTEIIQNPNP